MVEEVVFREKGQKCPVLFPEPKVGENGVGHGQGDRPHGICHLIQDVIAIQQKDILLTFKMAVVGLSVIFRPLGELHDRDLTEILLLHQGEQGMDKMAF